MTTSQQPIAERQQDPAYLIHPGNIPDEMKALDQWVCWIKEKRDGKVTKVPYIPSSRGPTVRAGSTNPQSWRSFDVAMECATNFHCGIGFVFNGEVIGIDLDAKPELSDVAKGLLDMTHSYTEASPSGGGRHIFVKGAVPDWFTGGRQGPVEVYTTGRYFTVTGNRINGHVAILEDQALVDKALQVVMPSAKQRALVDLPESTEPPPLSFKEYLPEETLGYLNGFGGAAGDDSEDDYAAIKDLLRIHPDAEWAWGVLVEAAPREDAEKYNRPDYKQKTLQRAWASLLSACDAFDVEDGDKPTTPSFVSLYDIIHGPDMGPIFFSVAEMMTSGLHIFGAAPKTGKTRFMLQTAITVSVGGMLMGSFKCEKQKVLYYMLEDSMASLKSRLMEMGLEAPTPEDFVFKFNSPNGITGLRADLIATGAKFCVIDTAAMFLPEDNGKVDAYTRDTRLFKPLKALCDELGVTIVIITHTTKATNDDNPFAEIQGSLGKQGMASGMMVMRRVPRDKDRVMLHVLGRDLSMAEWMLESVPNTPLWQIASEEATLGFGSAAAQSVLQALRVHGTSRAGDIAEVTGLTRQWVHRLLNRMLEAKIVSVNRHQYTLTNVEEVVDEQW